NDFCHAWYVDQRAADQRFPTPQEQRTFAAVDERQERVLTQRLASLTPPPAMAEPFAGFVADEQRMVQARAKLASADAATRDEGDDEYNTAIFMRHGYARRLGAEVCDGKLPHPQEVAAERAAQRYDLTTSAKDSCGTLVTRSFLASEWGGQSGASPLAKCRANLRSHLASGPHRNIRVVDVTGVENVSATVFFPELPDCGCGTVSARLYFDRGRWLVNHVSVGQ